jgi:magnesium transporter
MPVVASIGGNFGTQALTVSVRALSARELTAANATRTLWRELISGWLVGACVAFGLAAVVLIFWHDATLAGVIAGAILINFTMAALAGTLIPMTASKLGVDPAGASPIFVTLVTDFCGFFSFLGLAAIILL